LSYKKEIFNKLHTLTNILAQLKIKIFDFYSIKWFFLSLIAISTLFTVSSSFLLGFSTQNLFTDDSEKNILIISEPKITPAQSQIPLFWIEDITQLPGIELVSPETVDLVIDQSNGQSPYFRGVTDNYKQSVNDFSILEGSYFETETNSTKSEVIVGKNYASLFNINIGDNLVLQSRPRTVVFDVVVTGIFSTGSIVDDGILGPLWIGRLFGGLSDSMVNIIRIKFDDKVINKNTLQDIILNQHELIITVSNPFSYNLSISQSTVELYSRFKDKINQSNVNDNNEVNFKIPFGKYYVKLQHPAFSISKFKVIFVKENLFIELPAGTQFANFSAEFSVSSKRKENATIFIENQDINTKYNYTTNELGRIKDVLPLGTLKIVFLWKEYQNTTIINFQSDQLFFIDFVFEMKFILKKSFNNDSLPYQSLKIINLEDSSEFNSISDSNGEIIVKVQPETPYSLISLDPNYYRRLNIEKFNNTDFSIYLGKNEIRFLVKDIDAGIISHYPFNLTISTEIVSETLNETIVQTNNGGLLKITAFAGSYIILSTKYGISNEIYSKTYIIENFQDYYFFLGKQEFFLQAIIGSNLVQDFSNSEITIINLQTNEKLITSLNTNLSSKIYLKYGNYSISSKEQLFNFYNEYNFNSKSVNLFKINLDFFNLDITFLSLNNSLFIGKFELLKKYQNSYSLIKNFETSEIKTTVQNGLYMINLKSNRYEFSKNFIIENHDEIQTLYVKEKDPIIYPINFYNFTIINSSVTLFVNQFYTKNTQFSWDTINFLNYETLNGISPPSVEATYQLSIKSVNFDNIEIINTFFITIDNSGPIAYLLNQKGNNSWINFNLIPEFSFSENPKNILYTWDMENISTQNPTQIPNSQGNHTLTVEILDFANNMKFFYYVFHFDTINPQLISSNPLNNTIINYSSINLTFSENINALSYQWNNEPIISGTSQIPIPILDGTNYTLHVFFQDTAGNSNDSILFFPIIDVNQPYFLLNNYANESILTQINNTKLFFSIFNSNKTVFYNWNNSSWKTLFISDLYLYYLVPPFQNGPINLDIEIYDEFNLNNIYSVNYQFYGNFTIPQFNVSLDDFISPNQSINILFPEPIINWTLNWDYGVNNSGVSNFTNINSPTTLGNHSLILNVFDSNTTNKLWIYNFILENAIPHLENPNITYLSTSKIYSLLFPSYTSNWSYSWDNSTIYSGTNLSSILILPSLYQGNQFLYVTYTTIFGNTSTFNLEYFLDSNIPEVNLLNAINLSEQKEGFLPKLAFSENITELYYSWDNLTNSTILSPMPFRQDNYITNLTIFMSDSAGNWNKTTFSFYQDNSKISLQLNPANTTINNNYVIAGQKIIFEVNETPSIVTCSWNNLPVYNCNLSVPIIDFQGRILFILRVYDHAGNLNYISLILFSDKTPPILTNSNIHNNTIINSEFHFEFNFSEQVLSGNSVYSWNNNQNITGFPTINTNLTGFQVLYWWFSDQQQNWISYIFNVFIDIDLPSVFILGNYSNYLRANSTLQIIVSDLSNQSIDIFYNWNSDKPQMISTSNLNDKFFGNNEIRLILPEMLGNNTLELKIRDNSNNWNNQSYNFLIIPFLSISVINYDNNPIENLNIKLYSYQPFILVNESNNQFLSLFVEPNTYSVVLQFESYNLTSIIDLRTSSFEKTVILKKTQVQFTNEDDPIHYNGFILWNDSFLVSSNLFINKSASIFVSNSKTNFKAVINNLELKRVLDYSYNNYVVNFTSVPKIITLRILSTINNVPIESAIIKNNELTLGLTNKTGLFSKTVNPDKYSLTIFYKSFTKTIEIELFEDQIIEIYLPVTSNITIIVVNTENYPMEYISTSLNIPNHQTIKSDFTNFEGKINWNLIPWGSYEILLNDNQSSFTFSIIISDDSEQKNNVFIFILPVTRSVPNLGSNLGKWTFNRNYEISDGATLSDKTLENLGFSIIFLTLFLIIALMTFMSLISLLHQPIYKIRLSIKDLRRLGATSSQILSMVSVQLSVLSCIMAIFGYLVGQTLILFWPNLQQFPIAGMIIKPNHTDIFIPLFLISSFSIISGLYAYYYTKIEYFKFKI
jgi:hypothetical protein